MVVIIAATFWGLLSGCNSRRGMSGEVFTLEDARTIQVEPFRVLDQTELGRPGAIICWDEDRVIVADRPLPSLLSLINVNTGEKRPFLKMGRGPGECLGASNLTEQNGKLYLHSIASKKMIVLQESKDTDSVFSLVEDIPVETECIRIIPTRQAGYIGTVRMGGRFVLFSADGSVVDTLGTFPNVEGEEEAINNTALQSMLAFSPDGKYFCSAFTSMDFVEIYTNNFKTLKRLWGPEQTIPRVMRIESGGFIHNIHEPHKQVYGTISTSDQGFLVGYVGHLYKDRDDPSRCTKELFYFDWDGHFLARYLLPEEVAFFDVDWKNARMYGVTAGVEAKLVVAQLEGLNELSFKR